MPKVRLLAVGAVLLLPAACSSGPSAPSPAPSAPATTESSSEPTDPSASCPDGTYRVTGIEGRGAASSIGRGSGGNVAAEFRGGTFTISSDGSQPVKLKIGPASAELRLDGEIKGTYEGEPPALRMTATDARGNVTVKGLGTTKTSSASGLADQLIGRDVTAQVTCDEAAGTAQLTLPNADLTLTRAG